MDGYTIIEGWGGLTFGVNTHIGGTGPHGDGGTVFAKTWGV